MTVAVELFHEIADPGSARVRKYVVDHELQAWVKFRNVRYSEVQRDFELRGGTSVPALWDGEQLIQGADAVIARLQALTDIGRAP